MTAVIAMLADVDAETARFVLILSAVYAVAFSVGGFFIARTKGANGIVGAIMGLMCGLVGLYFASRLPASSGRSTNHRIATADDDLGGVQMIPPDVVEKYGLPPQRMPGAPVVPPTPGAASPGQAGPGQATPGQASPGQAVPGSGADPFPPVGGWQPVVPSAAASPSTPATPGVPVAPAFGSVPAEASSAPPPFAPTTGWWAPDPTGRYPQRWWDGAVWTHRVLAADGTEHVDTGG